MLEIPEDLKNLYKHWDDHTQERKASSAVKIDRKLFSEVLVVANERMAIWNKKQEGLSQPYTTDRILSTFRFCNIYRELDRQTIESHRLLLPLRENFSLWLLNIMFCRFVCNTDTIRKTGLLSFDEEHNQNVLETLRGLPSPKYGTPYVFPISIIQRSQYPTREEFFCLYLPYIVKKLAAVISTFGKKGVSDALVDVLPIFGFNFKFHLTEILIDVAYQYPQYIDLYKRFPIGPGAEPTMKRFNKNESCNEVCLALASQPLLESDFNYLSYNGKPVLLSAENWEGIGCEFRKYTNLTNGEGRRRLYR